jgi:hypothetical protein
MTTRHPSQSVLHTFVYPNGQQIEQRFLKITTVGQTAAAFEAQSIHGISSNLTLGEIPQRPLHLCYHTNIIWDGICFISKNQIQQMQPFNCPPEDERYVRTTIHTPKGVSVRYERQQKLHITVNGEQLEYGLTGNTTLKWIREWFERKAKFHHQIRFFSGCVEFSDNAEEEEDIVAFEVTNLSVKMYTMKENKRMEWIPPPHDTSYSMFLWSDPVEGMISDICTIDDF